MGRVGRSLEMKENRRKWGSLERNEGENECIFFLERRNVFWSKLQMVWSRNDEVKQLDTQLVSLEGSLFGYVYWTTYLSHLIFFVLL